MSLSAVDREECARILQCIADDPALIQDDERLKTLISKIYRTAKQKRRASNRIQQRANDQAAIGLCAMVQAKANNTPCLMDDAPSTLIRARSCYVCKQSYTLLDAFYHLLCPSCAALNHQKRAQRADLHGRVALLTGGRIKIGYQVALRLLRDGARVVLTTRFPEDAARRFTREPDAADWQARLAIHGLDLRDLGALERFIAYLQQTEPVLDILINNAAQTIKRPLAFYQHLLASSVPPAAQALLAPGTTVALLEAHPLYRGEAGDVSAYFPAGVFDLYGQQHDARPTNSWRATLDQVSTLEMLEVQLVNAVAPFLLASKLKALLLCSPHPRRFIVNVSAMEGQFGRENKTPHHPHTNMAKAALNMLTRTAAADYARDGIFMNSVDTGWITDENPFERQQRIQAATGFLPPLDVVDGMARIYDPIVQGINGAAEPIYGQFLKDYRPHAW